MRLRGFLLGTTLMSVTMVSFSAIYAGNGTNPQEAGPDSRSDSKKDAETGEIDVTAPAPLIMPEDKVINSAYQDAFSILRGQNRCSEFFGGSDVIDVLNRFVRGLKKEYVEPRIGLRMSGLSVNMLNASTNRSYRLFEKMAVNLNGPFYRSRIPSSQHTIQGIGSFEPNSREGRVVMILHELGHLIKGPGGNWLLPDDGRSSDQSLSNSRTIEKICNDQIRSLSRKHAERDWAAKREGRDSQSLAGNTADSHQQILKVSGP